MKKLLLTTILILGLTVSIAHTEEVEEGEGSEDKSPKVIAKSVAPTTSIAQQAPEAGISGSIMPFLQESFQVDSATGAATLSVPVTIPPARKNLQPNIILSYSSNNGNGICGVGWSIPINTIQRSTRKGVPTYDNREDTFIFNAAGSNAELVNIKDNQYSARIESGFMRYIFNNTANSWVVYDKSGTRYIFGSTPASRLENENRTFAWYLDKVEDTYGNYISYSYTEDGAQTYLSEIRYTAAPGLNADKRVIFNYEDRPDASTSYRTGWSVTTAKRLKSIEVKLNDKPIWTYKLSYIISKDTGRSLLEAITVFDAEGNPLPPKMFTYQTLD